MSTSLLAFVTLLSVCDASAGYSLATLLRAEGTNHHDKTISKYSLDTSTPTLTWSVPIRTTRSSTTQRGVMPVSHTITMTEINTGRTFVTNTTLSSQPRHVFNHVEQFPLSPGYNYEWKVSGVLSDTTTYVTSSTGRFHVSLLDDTSWDNVAWIGSNDTNVYQSIFDVPDHAASSSVSATSDAFLYIAGFGYSDVQLNGKKVGDHHLVTAPWTANERLVGFSALDVSSYLLVNQTNTVSAFIAFF